MYHSGRRLANAWTCHDFRAVELQTALESTDRIRSWLTDPKRLVWLTPVVVYLFVRREPQHVHTVLEGLLGLGLVLLVAKYPYRSLFVLLVFLPFELIAFSLLLHFGVPAQLLRGLGFWKEGVVAGLVVAAVLYMSRSRPKLDWADRLVIGYVVLGLAYLAVPHLFLSSGEVGANLSFYTRELGWRSDVLYPVVFLACRHLPFEQRQAEKLTRGVMATGTAVAAIGVYEFFNPGSFNHFLVHTAQLPQYHAAVLHSPIGTPTQLLTYASNGHVRVGSVFIDSLTDSWYYMLVIGLVMERIARGRTRPWLIGALILNGLALVFTQSRGAIIGTAIVVLVAVRSQIGRSVTQRVRMSSFFALVLVAAVPLVVFTGLAHRFVSSHQSNQAHSNGITEGLRVMGANPLGRGLATGSGAGQIAAGKGLISTSHVFDPENQWLLVGTELGILGLVLYSGAIVFIIRGLNPRTADTETTDAALAAGGVRNAMFGLAFGTIVAQPFLDHGISWTVFGLCGLALGVLDRERRKGHSTA